jgi:hypothetical protein
VIPPVRSAAMQKPEATHDSDTRACPPVTTSNSDHPVPFQLDTAPSAVPTTHLAALVHESAVKAGDEDEVVPDPGRSGTGALQDAPRHTRTLPALSTARQKVVPAQETASMTPTGSTSTGRDHAVPSHCDAPPMAAMQNDGVVQEMPEGPPQALKAPDQVVPSNT